MAEFENNNNNYAEAPTEPLNTKTCNICGTKVPETENKCPQCGHDFNIVNNQVYKENMGMEISLTEGEKERLIGRCKTVGAIYLAYGVFWCWLILTCIKDFITTDYSIYSLDDAVLFNIIGTVLFIVIYGIYGVFCFLKFNKYHNKLPKMLETDNAPFFREMKNRNFVGQVVLCVFFGLLMLLPVIYTNNSLVKETNKILMARGRQAV